MKVGTIKVKIVKDNFLDLYKCFIYSQNGNDRYLANPVKIVIDSKEPHDPSTEAIPTFSIDATAFDIEIDQNTEIGSKKVILDQKENDKNCHIKSLEQIIGKMIEVKR